jgi:hypothetical protein
MSTTATSPAGPCAAAEAPGPRLKSDHQARPGAARGILIIAGFFAVLTVMAYGLDALIASGLRAIPTSKFGSMNRVMSGRVNAAIVINGSSRALVHFDPRIIQAITGHSAYNLGMNSTQIDVQLAVLKAYLNHNVAPRLVIQNLEAFTFEATRAGEIFDPAVYLPYLDDPDLYAALLAIDPVVWKWKHVPLHGYGVEDVRFTWISGLLGHVGISRSEDYFQGFNPRSTPWSGEFERFRASVPGGIRYPIEPRGMRALTQLIQLCRERGIDLILVYSPEYIEMQALERNRAQIFARFHELATRFEIPLWDYSDSLLSREKSNFYNSQHLNATGAANFSHAVAHRLAATGYAITPDPRGGDAAGPRFAARTSGW